MEPLTETQALAKMRKLAYQEFDPKSFARTGWTIDEIVAAFEFGAGKQKTRAEAKEWLESHEKQLEKIMIEAVLPFILAEVAK